MFVYHIWTCFLSNACNDLHVYWKKRDCTPLFLHHLMLHCRQVLCFCRSLEEWRSELHGWSNFQSQIHIPEYEYKCSRQSKVKSENSPDVEFIQWNSNSWSLLLDADHQHQQTLQHDRDQGKKTWRQSLEEVVKFSTMSSHINLQRSLSYWIHIVHDLIHHPYCMLSSTTMHVEVQTYYYIMTSI